jgi:hypothetical protein
MPLGPGRSLSLSTHQSITVHADAYTLACMHVCISTQTSTAPVEAMSEDMNPTVTHDVLYHAHNGGLRTMSDTSPWRVSFLLSD